MVTALTLIWVVGARLVLSGKIVLHSSVACVATYAAGGSLPIPVWHCIESERMYFTGFRVRPWKKRGP